MMNLRVQEIHKAKEACLEAVITIRKRAEFLITHNIISAHSFQPPISLLSQSFCEESSKNREHATLLRSPPYFISLKVYGFVICSSDSKEYLGHSNEARIPGVLGRFCVSGTALYFLIHTLGEDISLSCSLSWEAYQASAIYNSVAVISPSQTDSQGGLLR